PSASQGIEESHSHEDQRPGLQSENRKRIYKGASRVQYSAGQRVSSRRELCWQGQRAHAAIAGERDFQWTSPCNIDGCSWNHYQGSEAGSARASTSAKYQQAIGC